MQHRRISRKVIWLAAATLIGAASVGGASAAQWTARVAAQSPDMGSQVQAFLTNEMWIHAGDSIRWTLTSTEIHTVTFLTASQPRPANFGARSLVSGSDVQGTRRTGLPSTALSA
jgi:plastocyanin